MEPETQLDARTEGLHSSSPAAGRVVSTVLDGRLDAGPHEVTWDGSRDGGGMAGSGVYFYKLDAPGRTEIRKATLLR